MPLYPYHFVAIYVIVNVVIFYLSVIGYTLNHLGLLLAILPKLDYSPSLSYRDALRQA